MTARRVLIIDDDDGIREVAKMSLELVAGWDVATAGSGAEGLARARESPPSSGWQPKSSDTSLEQTPFWMCLFRPALCGRSHLGHVSE